MNRPRIGITSSISRGADPGGYADLRAYRSAVESSGGECVVLYTDDRDVLGTLDGLLVSGGADVDPGRYGEPDRYPERRYERDSLRDAFEFAALAHARVRDLPTLCICRGMQVANVVFGGTLHQDLIAECGPEFSIHQHRDGGRDSYAIVTEHVVEIDPQSALARIVGTLRLPTNSVHHQAVAELSPALRIVAHAPDGTVEAVEAAFEHPFFIGIQWHPEETADGDRASREIFRQFVAAATHHASRRAEPAR